MVEEGIEPGYASKLIQFGWETVTEALKIGGITNMMDRLSNPAKIKAFDVSEELKDIMRPLFQKHQDDIIFIPTSIGAFGIDSYNLVDTTIAYEWEQNGLDWRVSLVGKNLSDTEYIEQALPTVGFQSWGPPRYIGLEVGFFF